MTTDAPPNTTPIRRQRATRRVLSLLALSWIGLRLVTDFPRGLMASGVNLPAGLGDLSYFMLPLWLLAVFTCVRLHTPSDSRFRPVVSAGIALMIYQVFALANIGIGFGVEGLVAGSYILLVGLSFIIMTLLGHELGRHLCSEADVVGLGRTLLWLTAPNLAWGLVQLLFDMGREIDGVSRIYGLTSSPNILTAVAAVNTLGLITLSAFLGGRRSLRWATIAWFALAASTFSLAGIGSLLAALLVWRLLALDTLKTTLTAKVVGAVTLTALGALAWTLAADIFIQRLSELDNDENSLVWRLFVWQSYLAALSDPMIMLFGGGLGYDHLATPDDAHNEYLRVAVEIGLLGSALFLAPFFLSIRSALRWRRSPPHMFPSTAARGRGAALTAGIVAIVCFCLINGTVEAVLRSSPSMLLGWFYIGLFSGLLNTKESLQ